MAKEVKNTAGRVVWKSNPILDAMGSKEMREIVRIEPNERAEVFKKILDGAKELRANYLNPEQIKEITGKSLEELELTDELDNYGEISISDIGKFHNANVKKTTKFDDFLENQATDQDYIDIVSGKYGENFDWTYGYGDNLKGALTDSKFNSPRNNNRAFSELSRSDTGIEDRDLKDYKEEFSKHMNLDWNTMSTMVSQDQWKDNASSLFDNPNFKKEHAYKMVENHPQIAAHHLHKDKIFDNRARDLFLNKDDNWGHLDSRMVSHLVNKNARDNTPDGQLFGDERDKNTSKFASQVLKHRPGAIGHKDLDQVLGGLDETSRNNFINETLGITGGSHETDISEYDSPEQFNENNWDNWEDGEGASLDSSFRSNIANSRHLNDDQIDHIKRHGDFDSKYNLYHNKNIDAKHGVEMYNKWSENHDTNGYDSDQLIERYKEDKSDTVSFNDLPEEVKDSITQDDDYYEFTDQWADESYTMDDYMRDNEDQIINDMGSEFDDVDEISEKMQEDHDWIGENQNSSQNAGNPEFDALNKLHEENDRNLDSYSFTVDELKDDWGIDPANYKIEPDDHGNIDGEDLNQKLNEFGGPSQIDYSNHEDGINAHPEFDDRYEETAKDWRRDALDGDKRWDIADGLSLYEGQRESQGYEDARSEAHDEYVSDNSKIGEHLDSLYEASHQDDRFIPEHVAESMPEFAEIRDRRKKQQLSSSISGLPDRTFEHEYGEDQHSHELALDYANANNGSIDIGRLHKQHPNLKETWKKIFAGKGKLSSDDIQQKIDSIPKTKYDMSYGNWKANKMQNVNSRDQIIFRLDHSDESLKPIFEHEDSNVKDMFNKVQSISKQSGHPTNDRTIAWARVDTSDPEHWMIDEVQSDFGKTVTKYLKEEGHGDKANAVSTISDLHKDWRENLVNHVIKTAKQHGAGKVSTHSPESKRAHASYSGSNVHSVYKDSYKKVPRKMGFKEEKAENLPLTEKGMKYFKNRTEDNQTSDIEDHTDALQHHMDSNSYYNEIANSGTTHISSDNYREKALSFAGQHKELAGKHSEKLKKAGIDISSRKPSPPERDSISDRVEHLQENDKIEDHHADTKVDKPMGKPAQDVEYGGHTYNIKPKFIKCETILLPHLMKTYRQKYAALLKIEHHYQYNHTFEDGLLHITAHDPKGNKIGHAKFSTDDIQDKYMRANREEFGVKGVMPEDSHVKEEHRRNGVASNMYRMAHKITGQELTRPPEHGQTEDAKKLWDGKKDTKPSSYDNNHIAAHWMESQNNNSLSEEDFPEMPHNYFLNMVNDTGYKNWELKKIPLSSVSGHGGDPDSEKRIKSYKKMNSKGSKAPPIIATSYKSLFDGNTAFQTIDGHHRLMAAHENGETHIDAYVPASDTGSEKLDKSEWKNKYSYIVDADLEKGNGMDALRGVVLATTMAYGAHDMTSDSTRKPASVEPNYSISQEAPKKENDYDKRIRENRKSHFMSFTNHQTKHLDPQKTTDVINNHPELKERYGHLSKDPYGTAQKMRTDESFRNSVHDKYFDHLYKKFNGNLSHIAHAWKHSPEKTRKYIESGKSTKDNAAVKRFFKY